MLFDVDIRAPKMVESNANHSDVDHTRIINSRKLHGKNIRKVYSLGNLPNTINGIALGSAGTAVMLKNIGEMYDITAVIKWPFFIFLFWSACLMLVYIMKGALYYTDTIKSDFVNPLNIARSGVYCMSWCLVGSVLSTELIGLPLLVPQVIIIIGEGIQLVAMSFFFYVCYLTKTLPEPFFNAAVLSCIFPAITLPGNGLLEKGIREYCLSAGIIFFVILAPIEIYRTTKFTNGVPLVAKDQVGVTVMPLSAVV